MIRLPDFEAWAVFAKVVEHGSFAAAAADLGLSKPTVSKAVTRLEAHVGFSLLNRTSRRLSLTEAGRAALPRAIRILNEGLAAEDEALAQSSTPKGRVRLAAPLSFGATYLGSVLPDFLEAWPDITLDVSLSDRHVDVIGEGFDLAIRIARLEDSSLLARRLCAVRILLVAAPTYLDRAGRPTHPGQLTQHKAMVYTGGANPGVWRFTHPTFGEETVEPTANIWTDNADLLTQSLIAGRGLALQPEFLVWKELRDGLLEIALPDWSPPTLGLHLLMPPGGLRPLRVQKLVDHLSQSLSRPPWETGRT
jgi:DNA-binding transcriptional LysR family regulator